MACALFEPLKEDSSFRWEEPLLEGYGSAKGKGKMVNFHADVHQSMKGKRFLCTADGNCDEAFDSIELLMGHMRVHHRPTRFFRCEKCEQKFNTNRSLFKHLHVCLNHDEPGSVFGRRSTRATTGTTAAPPASILAAPASVTAALPVTAAAAGADVAAVPCGAEGNPLGTTIDASAETTATAADVATAPPVADTAATPVAVAAAPRGAVAALPSDVTVAPPDAASEERRAVDEMPELTCERAGAPPTLPPPPPPPSPPLGLPSGLPMPKLKSSEQHEMPHLKLGPGRASNARRKRKRRIGRRGGTVEAPAEEAPLPVAVLLRPEASAAPTLKRVLPSEDAMENSQGPASAVSDGSTEGASAVRHLAPPRLSRSSDESGEDGAPARTSLSKRKSKKVGGNASKSTVTTAGSVAPPPAPPHGGESGDDGVITAVSKVGKKKGAGRMGDLILPAGAPHLDSSCWPSLGESESGTGVAARTSAPKGKKKATSAHPDTRSTAHGGGADGGDGGTAQAGPPKRRRKAVGRGSETRSRVVAAVGKGAGKASTKTLLLKLRTDRAAGEETRWIREEARGDGSSCPGPVLPPLLASQERGAAAVARDDASDRGCGALAMASGDTGASGTESPVADCDDRTPPPPASSPPPPPPPPVRGRKGKAVAPVMGGSGGASESRAGVEAAAAVPAPALASEQDETPLTPRVASLLPPAHHSHPGWQAGSARWKAAGLSSKRRVSWQHTRGLYTCTNCSFSSLCRQEATRHVYEHSR